MTNLMEPLEKSPMLKMYSRIGKASLHQYSSLFTKMYNTRSPDSTSENPNLDDVLKKISEKQEVATRRKRLSQPKPSSAFTSVSRETVSSIGSRARVVPDPGWYNPSYELTSSHILSVPKFKTKKTHSRHKWESLKSSMLDHQSGSLTERNSYNETSDNYEMTERPKDKVKCGIKFDLQLSRPPFASGKGPPHPSRFSYNPKTTMVSTTVNFKKMLDREDFYHSKKKKLMNPNFLLLNSKLARKIINFSPQRIDTGLGLQRRSSMGNFKLDSGKKTLHKRVLSVPIIEKFDPSCKLLFHRNPNKEANKLCFEKFESAIIKLSKIK